MSSKNHYTKREQQLESVLATKQKQVAVLEQERSALVNKVCSATAGSAAAATHNLTCSVWVPAWLLLGHCCSGC